MRSSLLSSNYLQVQKMANGWTKQETYQLINIWGKGNIQAQLEGCKRNKVVFEKISDEMEKGGLLQTFRCAM